MIITSVRPRRRRLALLAVVAACLAPLVTAVTAPATASSTTASSTTASSSVATPPLGRNFRLPSNVERACGDPKPGHATCFALRRTDIVRPHVTAAVPPDGLSPDDLVGAYQLPVTSTPGPTVAIVDAFDGPKTEQDLAVYRTTYGLPACTTANGCFRKLNQRGQQGNYPAPDRGWASEISLDVDMVSAVCPQCKILLVEADSDDVEDLMAAVHTAVAKGAKYVSNSYGADWDPSAEPLNSRYTFPGVAMVASTGDFGYGPSFPATAPAVTAVGGTTLQVTRTGSGTTRRGETAWEGSGSGCATTGRRPFFQADVPTGCNGRAQADVAAVADPETGVATYDTYGGSGWNVAGGTSASAPIIAGVYALAGGGGNGGAAPSAYPYRRPAAFNDITSGDNILDGSCIQVPLCKSVAGWDGITGLGTPRGISGFSPASAVGDRLTIGAPSLASWGRGRVDLVARNARKQLTHRSFNGTSWASWTVVGGVLNSQPSLAAQSAGRLDAVALDTSNRLVHAYYAGGRWSRFELINTTPLDGAPSIASWSPGRLDVVARSTSGHLLHLYNAGAGWSGWEDRGGSLGTPPTMTSWGKGRLDVVALDTSNVLTHYAFGSGASRNFDTPAGGAVASVPGITSDASGHLQIVALATNGSLVMRTVVSGQGWGGWTTIGGPLYSAPSITSDTPGRLYVGGVDTNYQAIVRSYQAGRWSPWTALGGTVI